MNREQVEQAEALGRVWAEQRAEALLGTIPPIDWPDLWTPADNRKLSFPQCDERELRALTRIAEHEAAERWRELLRVHRADEDAEDEEQALEVDARHLYEALAGDLPVGLVARQSGERVVIEELATGREMTVHSLADAWKVVAEWSEHMRPA